LLSREKEFRKEKRKERGKFRGGKNAAEIVQGPA